LYYNGYGLLHRKHYIDQRSLNEHKRGKNHKRRVKDTNEVPYSIEESERAAGLGTYVPPPAKRVCLDLMETESINITAATTIEED